MTRDLFKRLMPATVLLAVATVVAAAMAEQQSARRPQMSAATETRPPVGKDSVKFLVLGDTGTGDRGAERSRRRRCGSRTRCSRTSSPSCSATTSTAPSGRRTSPRKFELPYKPLLDANIPFYASLGNHDDPNQRYYKPFGMGGQRFYTYQKKDVRFFALDSNYMDKDQQTWLEKELSGSNAKWKIAYFHHPHLLVRRPPRLGSRPARHRRAAVHQVRRQRGVCRPRAFLRAPASRRRAFTTSPPAARPSCAKATS